MPRCQLNLSAGNSLAPSATRLELPLDSRRQQSPRLQSHGIRVGIDSIITRRGNVATPRRCGQAPCRSGHWSVAIHQRVPPVAPLTDNMELLAEPRVKVEAATQLRDHLDVFTSGPSYPVFLKRVMPVFISTLNGPCTFQSTSNEQVRSLLGYFLTRYSLHIHRGSGIPFSRSSIDSLRSPPPPSLSSHTHWKPSSY